MDTKQLQQIAERCQQGDREAFALLYTTMRQPLGAVCLSYVHDEDVANDLLHDAFLLIFSQIGKLRDSTRAEAWMTMLARRVALLHLRQRGQQRQERLSSFSATALQSPHVGTNNYWCSTSACVCPPEAESSLAYQEILAAVDALPEGYRRVFRLFVLEDMTHQEIAALLHIDAHSSSSQLSHAKALLRRWLRPMVLMLIAVALPLGFWLWHTSKEQTAMTPAPAVADNETHSSETPPLVGRDDDWSSPSSCICPQAQVVSGKMQPVQLCDSDGTAVAVVGHASQRDGDGRTAADTLGSVSHYPAADTLGSVSYYAATDTLGSVSYYRFTGGKGGWMLAVTYSGLGNGGNLHLPYADAETNPMVYDSVAHHHRALTVALMVNRRLDDHWQMGGGLNYQRLRSDMLSGNTYVALSQHQVVQYVGIPVSVSWHYALGGRFSTYLSASATLSLPLRSTLESVYVMDGRSYEPTTERLHPGVQWSAGMGLGLQYNLTPHVGFFAEPGLHYHLNGSGSSVKTWNTEHPLDLSVPIGLRITF